MTLIFKEVTKPILHSTLSMSKINVRNKYLSIQTPNFASFESLIMENKMQKMLNLLQLKLILGILKFLQPRQIFKYKMLINCSQSWPKIAKTLINFFLKVVLQKQIIATASTQQIKKWKVILGFLLSSRLLNSKKRVDYKYNRIKAHSTSKMKIKFRKINPMKANQMIMSLQKVILE